MERQTQNSNRPLIHAKIVNSQTSPKFTSKLRAKFGTHLSKPALMAIRTQHLARDALLIFAHPASTVRISMTEKAPGANNHTDRLYHKLWSLKNIFFYLKYPLCRPLKPAVRTAPPPPNYSTIPGSFSSKSN